MNQKLKTIVSVITLPYYALLGIKKSKHYLIAPNGIGEIVAIFMYSKEYMDRNHMNNVTIVINSSRKECAEALNCKNINFLLVKSWYHKLMIAFGLSKIGNLIMPSNIKFIDDWERQNRVKDNNFLQIERLMGLEKNIHKLSLDIDKEKNDCKEIVYFNPYARTIDNIEMNIYEKISKILSKKYKCYTFVNGNQLPIKYTESIKCSLKSALEMVNKGKCLIGTRSGFIDLMTLSNTKIICLYNSMNSKEAFFSFQYCDWNKEVVEISIQDDNAVEKIINNIEI